MHILLTGCAGRIGRAIYHELVSHNHALTTIDRLSSPITDHQLDIRDYNAIAPLLEGVDAIIHTAALHAPHVPHHSEAEFESINVEATQALIGMAKAVSVKRFILTSTTALYGYASQHAERATWITEDTVPQPRTIYHRTKIAAEQSLKDAVSENFTGRVIRMSRCFPEPAPIMAAYRLHRGIDARDVATAHRLCLSDKNSAFEVYNISGTTPFHQGDCVMLKEEPNTVITQRAPDLAKIFAARKWALPLSIDRVYNSAKAQKELGWTPQFGFQSVLNQHDTGSSEVLPADAIQTEGDA